MGYGERVDLVLNVADLNFDLLSWVQLCIWIPGFHQALGLEERVGIVGGGVIRRETSR